MAAIAAAALPSLAAPTYLASVSSPHLPGTQLIILAAVNMTISLLAMKQSFSSENSSPEDISKKQNLLPVRRGIVTHLPRPHPPLHLTLIPHTRSRLLGPFLPVHPPLPLQPTGGDRGHLTLKDCTLVPQDTVTHHPRPHLPPHLTLIPHTRSRLLGPFLPVHPLTGGDQGPIMIQAHLPPQ